jgi:hypothetical protein
LSFLDTQNNDSLKLGRNKTVTVQCVIILYLQNCQKTQNVQDSAVVFMLIMQSQHKSLKKLKFGNNQPT